MRVEAAILRVACGEESARHKSKDSSQTAFSNSEALRVASPVAAPQLVASPVAAPHMMRQPYVLSLSPPGGPIDGNTTVEVGGRGLAAVRFVKFGDERGEVLHRGAAPVSYTHLTLPTKA